MRQRAKEKSVQSIMIDQVNLLLGAVSLGVPRKQRVSHTQNTHTHIHTAYSGIHHSSSHVFPARSIELQDAD